MIVAKKKLIHFTENISFPHLFQPRYQEIQPHYRMRGIWSKEFFRNDHPIILELGCGKGEYTVGLARQYPNRNFIGIDIKGARLWRGCKTVEEDQLKNVAFIRARADHLEQLFAPGEVSEIWITFPDPQPGKKRKRLTSPVFLNRYQKILTSPGIVHLKTDDPDFFAYTRENLEETKVKILLTIEDLYAKNIQDTASQIQTFYEKIWLEEGKKISYMKFQF